MQKACDFQAQADKDFGPLTSFGHATEAGTAPGSQGLASSGLHRTPLHGPNVNSEGATCEIDDRVEAIEKAQCHGPVGH